MISLITYGQSGRLIPFGGTSIADSGYEKGHLLVDGGSYFKSTVKIGGTLTSSTINASNAITASGTVQATNGIFHLGANGTLRNPDLVSTYIWYLPKESGDTLATHNYVLSHAGGGSQSWDSTCAIDSTTIHQLTILDSTGSPAFHMGIWDGSYYMMEAGGSGNGFSMSTAHTSIQLVYGGSAIVIADNGTSTRSIDLSAPNIDIQPGSHLIVENTPANGYGVPYNAVYIDQSNSYAALSSEVKQADTITTTNNSTTTIATIPLPTSLTTMRITVSILGDGGSTGQSYASKTAVIRNTAGTLALVGSAQSLFTQQNSGGFNTQISITTSGTNVLVQVTGLISTNIKWYCNTSSIIN